MRKRGRGFGFTAGIAALVLGRAGRGNSTGVLKDGALPNIFSTGSLGSVVGLACVFVCVCHVKGSLLRIWRGMAPMTENKLV